MPQPTTLSPRLHALQQLSIQELDALFASGRVPSFERYAGPMDGMWLHRKRQPWWAAAFVWAALDNPIARWTGKAFVTRFDEHTPGSGVNLFANRWAALRYQMHTRIQPADRDGRPCLALVYPPGSVMFGLVDDMREIEDGLLLGHMGYRFPWDRRQRPIGYFTLEHYMRP